MNNSNKHIIDLYFKSINGFNKLERMPKDFGTGDELYSSEIHTLTAIGNHSGINLTELAEHLSITKSGASKFVKKLLEKSLITKSKLMGNKKEVIFELTKKGYIAYEGHSAYSEIKFASIHELINRLNTDERKILENFLEELTFEVDRLTE